MAAESGAHIHTYNGPQDDDHDAVKHRPNIFQIYAQEGLLKILPPAFNHLCRVIASHYPQRFGWMHRFCDELFVLLDLLVEYKSLVNTGASFSENFYGLKRVTDDGKALSKVRNLLLLVFYPYLRRKAEQLYASINQRLHDHNFPTTPGRPWYRLAKLYVTLYPYVHGAWELLLQWYALRFLFNYSDVHSPLLKLSSVTLETKTIEDAQNETPTIDWEKISSVRRFPEKLALGLSILGSNWSQLLLQAFSTSVFFLQFLQWYHSLSTTQSHDTQIVISVPPPKVPSASQAHCLSCPICHKTRSNAAVLSVSGYVYCYPCIFKYIQQHGVCAVTGYPAKTEHLVRLYVPEE